MRYTISGKNIQVTEALREATIDKLSKLDKYFAEDNEAIVTFSVLKKNHTQIIEVTIPIKGTIIRAEEKHDESMYAAIDLVVDVLERQLLKHRKKLIQRHRHHGTFRTTYVDQDIDMDVSDEAMINIVRSKSFPMKPMDAEEACMEMELLGHSFFVFRDSESDEINVVYKRKDGQFGLISPE